TNKNRLSLSPDGKTLAYCRATGELVVTPTDKFAPRAILPSTVFPGYDWSPDGRWLAVQSKDSEDNWDVWIVSVSGEAEPFNLSRHPSWDGSPRWSPDGCMLAFVGKRGRNDEMDLHYVYFVPADEDQTKRKTKLEDARQKLRSARISSPPIPSEKPEEPSSPLPPLPTTKPPKKLPRVVIDFENLHERIRRIELADSKESDPFWHQDSRKLAFTSDWGGNRGTYQVQFPNDLDKPKLVTKTIGADPHWSGNEIHWLVNNLPSKSQGSSLTKYTFKAYQDTDREQYLRLAYRILWRNLRDFFYDEKMNGQDWDALLHKYENHISANIDKAAFARLISLLMGELNASHLFFDLNDKIWPQWQPDHGWRWETVHLGLLFDHSHKGSGLKVKEVLPGGPCHKSDSRIYEDEIILSVDGNLLNSPLARRQAFNRRLNQVAELEVKDPVDNIRVVSFEPIAFSKARELAKEAWISDNQGKVDELSGNKLGYLHVNRMNWDDLERFEAELFSIGYGKQGLVIDVRNNRGGFTADHMLKMLMRPVHAVTFPRSGKRSYPLGYLDHYFWDKPIVVLCNQNTASNGEIFCHAIKASKRGKLVGVRTAGSVISVYTDEKFLDVGKMSVPFRGWFKADDGRDMERNGAVPDFEIWPKPGEMSARKDRQLEKAVEVLLKECREFKDATLVELEPASARQGSVQQVEQKPSPPKQQQASEKKPKELTEEKETNP
ncbi:MAG: S41 family peptidase, partial [Opitutales bacterium]